jgi:hypothetical protein
LAKSLEEKVAAILMLLEYGSVLVYSPQDLCDVLKAQIPDLVLIDENIDP